MKEHIAVPPGLVSWRNAMKTALKVFVLAAVSALFVVGSDARAAVSPRPMDHRDQVVAHGIDDYTVWFRAYEPIMILVEGDGDTDLDLYVYDEHGVLIDFDEDLDDTCLAIFRPRRSGLFTIRIVNLGDVHNVYRLRTN
jgi:hypothetical protein